jgi:flagellar assembly protein FliH
MQVRLLLHAGEETISLSRLIKSQWASSSKENQKVISIKTMQFHTEQDQDTVIHYDRQMEAVLTKAQMEAEQRIQEASLHAQSIREQISFDKDAWEQEKKKLIEQANREGFSQGFTEGKDQGYKEYQEALSFAKEVVQLSKKDYQQQIDSAEKTILSIGIKVAERIIGQKLEENESVFLSIVKRSLKEARDYHEVQLHVNPVHYGFILSQKEDLLAIFPNEGDLYIYPNEELSNESCIIESDNGRIDASVDSQLEEIKRRLSELLESESE